MARLVRVGLTGGIGSGKSTVARLLSNHGAALVDADAISRQLTAPGGRAMPTIAASFGAEFVTSDDALERDKMRALIHTDAKARQRLESIIHPLVAQETQSQSDDASAKGYPCIVFDVPLLVESSSWRRRVDHILVVDCTTEVQIDRVTARSRLSRTDIERIIASQASREYRLSAADSVLFNVALSLDDLAGEVRQICPRFGLSSG